MAFEDREMENLSAALLGLIRRSFDLWSRPEAGAGTDALAIECARARAEFERALATYIGVRSRAAAAERSGEWDQPAETSVGDSPIALPLGEARTVFETLYVLGAVALFDGDHALAAKVLGVDIAAIVAHLGRAQDGGGPASAELWATVSGLAQAGLERVARAGSR
jgi:hypothetical protein